MSTIPSDPFDPAQGSVFNAPTCQRAEPDGAPEYEYMMMSCPSFAKDTISTSTVAPGTTFDTVLALAQGNQYATGGGYCNDDDPFFSANTGFFGNWVAQLFPWNPKLQSTLGAPVSSGSGVRILVVDGYKNADQGDYFLTYSVPRTMANPRSTEQTSSDGF